MLPNTLRQVSQRLLGKLLAWLMRIFLDLVQRNVHRSPDASSSFLARRLTRSRLPIQFGEIQHNLLLRLLGDCRRLRHEDTSILATTVSNTGRISDHTSLELVFLLFQMGIPKA